MKRASSALCGMLVLAACTATTADWRHTTIADAAVAERQHVIDNGYCRQVAVGAAPMPDVQVPAGRPQPTGYEVAAETRTTGPGGVSRSTTHATVTPTQAGGFAGGFASGMSSGVAQGAALRQQIDARRAQDEIYRGCMYRLGWAEARG